jgi:hypothetical protein
MQAKSFFFARIFRICEPGASYFTDRDIPAVTYDNVMTYDNVLGRITGVGL